MTHPSRSSRLHLTLLAAALLAVAATPCWAGGGQHYPNGAEDLMVGALPPPGVYLKNYLAYINKNKLLDNDGDEKVATPMGELDTDLDASVWADVVRLIWVTPYKILGGSYTMHAFFPFYTADLNLDVGGAEAADSDESGMGDIIFSPFVLGWHFGPQFHMVTALDMYAPTGNWDEDEAASQLLSKNHWTFEPVVALSYFSGPVDLSLKLMYDIHTENSDTDTKPGQEFHFDWAAGYSFMDDFTAGATGFCHWQITDDKVDGDSVDDNRSQLFGIGPVFKYWPGKGRFSATAKYVHEFGGKNIAQGSTTWLNVIWAF